jgi:cell division initiation protein
LRITPLDIYQQEFKRVLRGFDPDEVEDFLERVAEDYEQLIRENASLEAKLSADETAGLPDDSRVEASQAADNLIREAKKEAESIIREARKEADNIVRRAREEVPEARADTQESRGEAADEDADAALEEANAKAKEILEKAKTEEMELRREISRLRGQKERFLIEYRELLEKHLKNLTEKSGQQVGE